MKTRLFDLKKLRILTTVIIFKWNIAQYIQAFMYMYEGNYYLHVLSKISGSTYEKQNGIIQLVLEIVLYSFFHYKRVNFNQGYKYWLATSDYSYILFTPLFSSNNVYIIFPLIILYNNNTYRKWYELNKIYSRLINGKYNSR